jgi:gas vesicle protein
MTHTHSVIDNPEQLIGVAVLSATIGALTAMLFTPRSGTATRQLIGDRLKTMGDTMKQRREVAAEVEQELQDTAVAARSRVMNSKPVIKHDTKRAAKELKDTIANAGDELDNIRTHGER